MMELLNRINELAAKHKEVGLTPAEHQERDQLRKHYLQQIRGQVLANINSFTLVDELGQDVTPEKIKAINSISIPQEAHNMNINGHHHISMITKDAKRNNAFYTKVLGLRRVNMTVNQDSPNMYHLFYGDRTGSPGTELTFFEIPNAGQTYKGTNSISRIGLFVPSIESLDYWKERFTQFDVEFQTDVTEYANKPALHFHDHEMLEMVLLVAPEQAVLPAHWEAWEKSDVPQEHRILGMGSVELKVRNPKATVELLHDIFGYEVVAQQGNQTIIQTKAGGVLSELVIIEEDGPAEKPGRGSVHHVAIRVENAEQLQQYDELLKARGIMTSNVVDRHYFESVYFRDANNILFELATDEPGFTIAGDIETLGEKLHLPPKFEHRREEIEAMLAPLD